MIPAEIREELGLDEGSVLSARVDGPRIVLETREAVLARVRQEFQKAGDRDLVAELLAQRREEFRREEEDFEEFERSL